MNVIDGAKWREHHEAIVDSNGTRVAFGEKRISDTGIEQFPIRRIFEIMSINVDEIDQYYENRNRNDMKRWRHEFWKDSECVTKQNKRSLQKSTMMISHFVVISLLIIVNSVFVASYQLPSTCMSNNTLPDRLPYSIVPSEYDLALTLPSPQSGIMTFNGTVIITANVQNKTSCVILNIDAGLSFNAKDVTLTQGHQTQQPTDVVKIPENGQVAMLFSSLLPLGTVKIEVR
jgi:hypothetical protein